MSPQCELVLQHLQKHKSISGVEASAVYRIRHLPRRIKDLKEAGYGISSEMKKGAAGQKYARYYITQGN